MIPDVPRDPFMQAAIEEARAGLGWSEAETRQIKREQDYAGTRKQFERAKELVEQAAAPQELGSDANRARDAAGANESAEMRFRIIDVGGRVGGSQVRIGQGENLVHGVTDLR